MKLGPLLFTLLCIVMFALVGSAAKAAPRDHEDALADGDVDADDIATAGSLLRGTRGPHAFPGPTGGSTYLSMVGFSRTNRIAEQHEVGGFLLLGLPFDRLARGGVPVGRAVAASTRELVPVAAQESIDLVLGPRLARACVNAAWRAAGLMTDEDRLDAIVTRARWSAILPEARLRAVRFDDARLSLDTSTDTSRLRDSAGANVGLEARLTWRFDRLVYADDEPAFERLRVEHRDARSRIGAKVLEALVHWQRATLDLRTLPPSQLGTRDESDVLLRIVEAEAALDILTSGWFASHKPRAKGRPEGRPESKPVEGI